VKSQDKNGFDFFQSLEYLQRTVKHSASASSASYGLITSILLFTYIGWYLDSKYDSSPIAVVVGVLVGIILGFYHLFKIIQSK